MISIVQVADAVAQALPTAKLPQVVLPERTNHPRIDRESLTSLRVLVSPRTRTSERVSREDFLRRHTVDVAFVAPVDPYSNEATDPLVQLAEAVADWFDRNPTIEVFDRSGHGIVRCAVREAVYGDQSSPLLSREAAEAKGMFMAITSLAIEVLA